MKTKKCLFCDKEITDGGWSGDDRFCCCDCAQKDYEDNCLQDELQNEEPRLSGLEDVMMRL